MAKAALKLLPREGFELLPRDRLLVVGKTGTGKSNWVKQLVAQLMAEGKRVVVFDVCDEYSQEGRTSKETRLGPLTQRCTADELIDDPARFLDREDLALAVVPDDEDDPEACAQDFDDVALLVKHTGNVVLVVEEVGYWGEHTQPLLKAAATMWRKNGVTIVFVSQRAIMVPLGARAQASQIVAFRQDEQADLAALQSRCESLIPDFSERVSRCAPGAFVHWRDDLKSPPAADAPAPNTGAPQ